MPEELVCLGNLFEWGRKRKFRDSGYQSDKIWNRIRRSIHVGTLTPESNLPGMLVKNYDENEFLSRYRILENGHRILNAGSSSTRFGDRCVNVDIQDKPNVDVVADIHDLPDSIGKFDTVICAAALQYCHDPVGVANQFYDVLREGGYLFVDAPWIQPFCVDTPDLNRYSEMSLRHIFSNFEILECGPSIRPGSAFAMLGEYIAGSLTGNKYVNFGLRKMTAAALYPVRYVRTQRESMTAGAFYLVARKPASRSSAAIGDHADERPATDTDAETNDDAVTMAT